MKTKPIKPAIQLQKLILVGIILISFISCTENTEDEIPRLISARVNNETPYEVTATFTSSIYNTKLGFTIKVNNSEIVILSTSGNGTRNIIFELNVKVEAEDEVLISYSSTAGEAEDENGRRLRSFSDTPVRNYVEALNLTVSLPTIPIDYLDYRVWLILKTDEVATKWASSHENYAQHNITLSATPTQSKFDIILYITSDDTWRPDKSFSTGYYATINDIENENGQYKVISWQMSEQLNTIEMGYIIELNNNQENTSFDNAYMLATDGKDYMESEITDERSIWFKFYAYTDSSYKVTINDMFTDDDYYNGGVEGVLMDKYQIEFPEIDYVLGGYPQNIIGKNEFIYIEVRQTDRGGKPGNFRIQVTEITD